MEKDLSLSDTVMGKKWERTRELIKNDPDSVHSLSSKHFSKLWYDAPLEVIRDLLTIWPDAYKKRDPVGLKLVYCRIIMKQWDFVKTIVEEFPHVATAEDLFSASKSTPPPDFVRFMLDLLPNAPIEKPDVIFSFVQSDSRESFHDVLKKCPDAAKLKHSASKLSPLLTVMQKKSRMNDDWISFVLSLNQDAVKEKDFDGKYPLHLARQHGASTKIIDSLLQIYPQAEEEKDNLGRTPKDLADQSGKSAFTPANEILIISDGSSQKRYPDDAVAVCLGDTLVRDLPLRLQEDKDVLWGYFVQVRTRNSIFKTLSDEFSSLVGIHDKGVIQKAATVQTLAQKKLSNHNDTIIDFDSCDNPGYWHQQEILKLVMRVYHEGLSDANRTDSSASNDARTCMRYLEKIQNGESAPPPSEDHTKAYQELTTWLTEGLDGSYKLQGPVLKPLQSLFNKLFIRRGQTNVHIIGDLVRATLWIDNKSMLRQIIKKVDSEFPNITSKKFKQPDKFDRTADFLNYVHDDLKFLPGSKAVFPYRFKMNSSQAKMEEPLWFNLNFFLRIPEYHRVGQNEMFVACELQIGLTSEINGHRQSHVAYERDRILASQPLLKNYDAAGKETEEGKLNASALSNCSDEDIELIRSVLLGKIAREVFVPSSSSDGTNETVGNIISLNSGPFSLSYDTMKRGEFVKPERLCINYRSLNWFASSGNAKNLEAAFVVAGPYRLDETRRYFVDKFEFTGVKHFHGKLGLYAHVGPYLVNIAGGDSIGQNRFVVVESGWDYGYLEQVCPIPEGTTALEVIVSGRFYFGPVFAIQKIELILKEYETI